MLLLLLTLLVVVFVVMYLCFVVLGWFRFFLCVWFLIFSGFFLFEFDLPSLLFLLLYCFSLCLLTPSYSVSYNHKLSTFHRYSTCTLPSVSTPSTLHPHSPPLTPHHFPSQTHTTPTHSLNALPARHALRYTPPTHPSTQNHPNIPPQHFLHRAFPNPPCPNSSLFPLHLRSRLAPGGGRVTKVTP